MYCNPHPQVYPILAYLFSTSFTDISSAAVNGLGPVRRLAITFMIVGTYALVMATIQTTCFEVVAFKATEKFRLRWFHALLRQDPAFFDVYNVSGIATGVGPAANRFRRGLGRKFGCVHFTSLTFRFVSFFILCHVRVEMRMPIVLS